MSTAAKHLDISALPPASRREVVDFYQFILERNKKAKSAKAQKEQNCFSDLCGKLSWKGDAVAAQRSVRDEW